MFNKSSLFASFPLDDTGYKCVFIADQNVAFGSISFKGHTGSRVWLYNCKKPPYDFPEPAPGVPLLNPKRYIVEREFRPVQNESEVSIKWVAGAPDPSVEIYIRQELHATMTWGERPGRCILALIDNGLARTMTANMLSDDVEGEAEADDIAFPLAFISPDGMSRIVVEKGSKAVYAYYLIGGRIASHVWLYNLGSRVSHREGGEPPVNPSSYVRPEVFTPPRSPDELQVRWTGGAFSEGHIYLRGDILAVLDDNPVGRNVWAAKDGPLARTLESR